MRLSLSLVLSGVLALLTSPNAYPQLDPTFGSGGFTITGTNQVDRPIGSFLLSDGKILIVNESFETILRYHLIRYNTNGTLDASFGTGGKVPITGILANNLQAGFFTRAVRQPDGKILLVGGEQGSGLVARIDENGALDTSFSGDGIHRPNINLNAFDRVTDAAFLPDGRIVVAGYSEDATLNSFLLRYLADGTVDGSFGTEGGYVVHLGCCRAQQVALQSTGKILISPAMPSAPANAATPVRRFNADGSLDNSFNQIAVTSLHTIALQADDKIIAASTSPAAGPLEQQNTDIRLARYNSDGSPDMGFGASGSTQFDLTSSRCDDLPNGLAILADGQILVSAVSNVQANRWTAFKGTTISLARFSSSGTLNGKFLEVDGYPDDQALLSAYPDGRILTAYRTRKVTLPQPGPGETDLLLVRATGVPLQDYKFRGVPFDFTTTLLADGRADPTVFRPSDMRWYIYPAGAGFRFGVAGDIPVPSDYVKDTGSEPAVFRPSEGRWYISRNPSDSTNFITIQWGLNGDIPAPADYDGDFKTDVTVFRPSAGVWYTSKSSDGSGKFTRWGVNGDKPAPGDYDGDRIDDIAVFRPSDGNWYILRSSNGGSDAIHFGLNGDIPVQEDYDGDGKTDIAVWRPSSGIWYRLNSSDGSFFAFAWGVPTDVATPADYDGDRKTDIAVWRPSQGRWFVYSSSSNAMVVYTWGLPTDLPVEVRQ
jgi:uncharacterized delta-60 repeat protein